MQSGDAMKLYYRPGACALAPHILLEEVGLAFDAIEATPSSDFHMVSPYRAVPVLITLEGKPLSQCGAILQFISELAGRQDLLGGDRLYARAEVTMWSSFFTGDFHPAFYPLFMPQRYTVGTTSDDLQQTKSAAIELIKNGLDRIELGVEKSDYLAGETLTIADFYATPMLRWCTNVIDGGLSNWPNVQRFYGTLTSRPSTVRAMKTQKIEP